jgi:hypothetical protein
MKTYVATRFNGLKSEITYSGTSEDKAISSIVEGLDYGRYGIVEVWEDDRLFEAFEVSAR